MSRCIICTQVEAVHPEVGDGYTPHTFEGADHVRVPGYEGPDRRKGTRRMDDRIAAVEAAVDRADRRKAERRAS